MSYDTDGVTLLDCDDADVGPGLVSEDLDCDGILNDDDVVVTDGLLVSAGYSFGCAIDNTGSVQCWGANMTFR